jgi:EAL domain-containing protein (putative c-di-GMP-specific phosphodiesterase class I)
LSFDELYMGHDNFEVEDALRNGWVEICYQPKIDLKRKCLIGAETLARLRHPRFGVMLPGSFFPGLGEAGVSLLAEHALIAVLAQLDQIRRCGIQS